MKVPSQPSSPSSSAPPKPPQPGESSPSGESAVDFLRQTAHIPETIGDVAGDGQQPGSIVQENEPISPELVRSALGPTFQALFHAVATQRGDHWELQEFERKALLDGWTPILQHVLAKLGNQEQVLLAAACIATAAIVSGKVVQDATKRALSMASTKMRESAASSASSASGEAARAPEQRNSYEELDES